MLRTAASSRLTQGRAHRLGRRPAAPLLRRGVSRFPKTRQGLHEPSAERDACGVGLVAQLQRRPSRAVVRDANQMLVRMSHRGGCGCEPNSGDGAGGAPSATCLLFS